MVIGFIIGCEIAFWIVLAAGLVLRYPLRRPWAGAVVLAAVPVVDLVLLVACAADLRGGATAGSRHALAALYLVLPRVRAQHGALGGRAVRASLRRRPETTETNGQAGTRVASLRPGGHRVGPDLRISRRRDLVDR
ncbi:hypothetical protein [Dactylosporangium cerinum]